MTDREGVVKDTQKLVASTTRVTQELQQRSKHGHGEHTERA